MTPWAANSLGLLLGMAVVSLIASALLWRVGSWHLSPAALLTFDEGIRIGSPAPQVAAHRGDADFHLSFAGRRSFVVFGTRGCAPCTQLVSAATSHPATADLRRVFISNADEVDLDPDLLRGWEVYRFHDEHLARDMWRAPVSPYFHLIDTRGLVVAKGVGNRSEHLDRLLSLPPTTTASGMAFAMRRREGDRS